MASMPLFRRRQVWVPTLWGGLLLLASAALVLGALAAGVSGFLAPNAPAHGRDGQGARTLIVEGWLGVTELAQAVEAFRRGHYERVLTTGGPIDPEVDVGDWKNYAPRAAAGLRAIGLTGAPVIAVPAPASKQDRTYLSAVMVREWAVQSGVALDSIDVFTVGVHARRSAMLYRMALGREVEVGVLSAVPKAYDAVHWWTSSNGAKMTMGEAVSLVWTACCFWPPAPGSHEERWAVPK